MISQLLGRSRCLIQRTNWALQSAPLSYTAVRPSRIYEKKFQDSIQRKKEFWEEQASKITWYKKWDYILDESDPIFPKWFHGGELNTVYNCLDRHIEDGYGEEVAVIYESPVTKQSSQLTYNQLKDKVARLAGVLVKHGVKKGDRVLIYMPMIPETMIGMLAAARIGAIHSVVFGGFAAKELATRIDHAKPTVVLAANVGVEPSSTINYKKLLDHAFSLSKHKPKSLLMYQRPGFPAAPLSKAKNELDWEDECCQARDHDAVPVKAGDPLYLLYTSGTTASPKGVVRPSGGYAVAVKWAMKGLYNMDPGDVWWGISDFGWVVGHTFICYAPLLQRCTTLIYEGKPVGTPDAGQYFRVLEKHNVNGLFVAPTALRAIRREDPTVKIGRAFGHPNLKIAFVAGEHCDQETLMWAREVAFRVPVYDHWWQTETGWPISCNSVGLGDSMLPPLGSAGRSVPGYEVCALNPPAVEGGNSTVQGKAAVDDNDYMHQECARIVVKLPLPPGTISTLYGDDERFKKTYFEKFPGYYDTMDAGFMDAHGYIFIMSRVDDVINVAGHRLSCGAMEEACIEHPDVVECAVVPIPDPLKGSVPLGLLVTERVPKKSKEEILTETFKIVRERIGPVAAFKQAIIVEALPKTRSGKIARGTIAAMAAGLPFKIPVTIEDPSVYKTIHDQLKEMGFNPSMGDE